MMEKEKLEEEDERREAAIASTPSLQPDFKLSRLRQTQLSKFQELHRRRLEIKSKSKFIKKPKDGTRKSRCEDLSTKDCEDKESSAIDYNQNSENSLLLQQENVAAYQVLKQRQKLHWGLDTKDRWERKANM